jgi:uncharacterized protein (DUF927 family)
MIEQILQKLSGVRKQGSGFQARCPAHADDKPSLSIGEKGGKILLHCHANCSIDDLCGALAIQKKDLFSEELAKRTRRRIDRIYEYKDETGEVLFQCVRYEPKDFRQRRPDGAGGWIWNLADTRLVLYRLPELVLADKAFPVFICEGEKDVDRLIELGLTATCNPLGAAKWKPEYSDHLTGRHCVVLPDNDEAGRKHAQTVATGLHGKAERVSILHLPGIPEKGDVSNWLAKGNTAEDLFALIDGAEVYTCETEGEAAPGFVNLPERYLLTDDGLYYQGQDPVFVCSPLRVRANTCDPDNTSWGKLLEFEDSKGITHSLVIPMSLLSGDGAEVRSRLMDCGLSISANSKARQYFLQYLLTAKPDDHVLCVNQLGWHDGAFVLPDEVISPSEKDKSLLLQNVDRTANKFKTSGKLEEWQEQIAKYCIGNSRLMFSVCTAFAAALLPIAEETSGGFHIYGTSSTGKTTALLVAGSVWGGDSRKGFLETWRATANGLEAVAELHNHSLLLLDEVSQVNPHEIGEVVYSLSNGFGKSRMNKNTTARRKVEWNLLFFSSGEKTLEQIMQSVNQRLFGGQEARFVNIEADARADNGVFEDLHGFESGNDLSKHLSSAARRHFGTAIRKFLREVCADEKTVRSEIREARQYFTNKLRYKDASGEVYRVASRFALVAAAGVLASDFGVTGWDRMDVIKCIERIFDEWLESRGTVGSFDTARGVQQVLSFIAQHGSSRFQSVTDTFLRIPNRAGFKKDNFEGETEYWILPEVFEGEICRGFRAVSVAKELERLGHLRRGAEKGYLSRKESLPELGRRRVYAVVYEDARENEDLAKQDIPF